MRCSGQQKADFVIARDEWNLTGQGNCGLSTLGVAQAGTLLLLADF